MKLSSNEYFVLELAVQPHSHHEHLGLEKLTKPSMNTSTLCPRSGPPLPMQAHALLR